MKEFRLIDNDEITSTEIEQLRRDSFDDLLKKETIRSKVDYSPNDVMHLLKPKHQKIVKNCSCSTCLNRSRLVRMHKFLRNPLKYIDLK